MSIALISGCDLEHWLEAEREPEVDDARGGARYSESEARFFACGRN